ncbi:BolA family protein [Brevundimonas sp.]|uniref:BolA family protein n=1 Tax=Brevundimonas sp. TaxID=1871086 RepID=UPI003AFA00C8
MSHGPIAQRILEKLGAGLSPDAIELVDDSARHAGHHHEGGMDAKPGGESHFNLMIVSEAFEGLTRVARQRQVLGLLREEMAGPVHALSVRALTPDEARRARDMS